MFLIYNIHRSQRIGVPCNFMVESVGPPTKGWKVREKTISFSLCQNRQDARQSLGLIMDFTSLIRTIQLLKRIENMNSTKIYMD